MGKHFEGVDELAVDATPEQVWQAIATGPGIDSWFMGRNAVEPGGEGAWTMTGFGQYSPTLQVTAWEDGKHLAYRTDEAPDGRFVAYEFLVEGRAAGSTTLRMVTSGFLPGAEADWADEYEAMLAGGALFVGTLSTYLQHFAGRTATPVTAFGPPVADWPQAWAALFDALGVTNPQAGDRIAVELDGLPRIDGVVYHRNDQTLGVRTPDALYRFIRGFRGPMIAAHHVFSAIEPGATERAWEAWLTRTF